MHKIHFIVSDVYDNSGRMPPHMFMATWFKFFIPKHVTQI